MDIRQLRYFAAIVDEGSISKASQRLNIAQPALSLHVRNMEDALGVSLLFRTTRGVVPTDAGSILLRHARKVIEQLEALENDIHGLVAEPSGEVRLGLPGTISHILSVPLIISAKERYPKVRLCIVEAMSGFITDWLHHDRIDLAVIYLIESGRFFTSRAVFSEDLYIFGPSEDPLRILDENISFGDLARLPLILPSVNHGLRRLIDRRAMEHNTLLDVDVEVDSYSVIKKIVKEGMGYSILPLNAISQEVQRKELCVAPRSLSELRREVHLVHQSNRPLSTAATAILELCCETLLQLVETGGWPGAHRFTSEPGKTENLLLIQTIQKPPIV